MPRSLRFASFVTTAAAGALVCAAGAFASPPPTGVAADPAGPTNAGEVTFSWGAAPADLLPNLVGYEYGFADSAAADPATFTATDETSATLAVPEGTVFFRVRSVEAGIPSLWTDAVSVLVDRTGPTVTGLGLAGSAGLGGWYRALTIQPQGCTDNGGVGGGCADQTWTKEGSFGPTPPLTPASITLTDDLGNTRTVAITTPFGFDKTKPVAGVPVGPGTLIADEAPFEWSPGSDALSKVDRYDVLLTTSDEFSEDYPNGTNVVATTKDVGGVGNYLAARATSHAALPVNVPLRWWVRTYDKAGNVKNSDARNLTIDPTVPPAPTITGGPAAPTRDTAPTFTWSGTENIFRWDVTPLGAQNPVRQGGGKDVTQTTLQSLPDGDYTFRVTQVTEAGRGSAEALRTFKVDTTPPAPPSILIRPTFPAIGAAPVFGWSIEPGAYSRWSVLDGAGTLVYGPIETPSTAAELPSFSDGPYTFQVAQVDAAGNVSPTTAEAFTVLAPLVQPTPEQNARTAFLAALPKQNALRLTPKAGTTLPTLRPVLSWKKGPRGTRLYNLQIFKVTQRKGTAKPRITKVLSKFPRGVQFRPAKKNLQAGTCYVWRVWPYTGTSFTARPVGVSNFCVAGKGVLLRKAKAKALKAAAAGAPRR